MRPQRLGPCLAGPPATIVWHCAHLDLKSFAPFFASPSGTSTSGSARVPIVAGEADAWEVGAQSGCGRSS